jgi:hypothetical protein
MNDHRDRIGSVIRDTSNDLKEVDSSSSSTSSNQDSRKASNHLQMRNI